MTTSRANDPSSGRWPAAVNVATPAVAVVIVLAAMLLGVSAAAPVSAHSGLGAASPAPGSTVGGVISEIQLRYAATVSEPAGSVIAPDGVVLAAEFEQNSPLAVTIKLAASLSLPGEYTVRHISTSVDDGDRVEAAYLFTYEPGAPPPQLEILETGDDSGMSPWVWPMLAAGVALIGALSWRLVAALRRARR